jgi:hypothetical protein
MKKGACTLPIRPPQVKEEEKTKQNKKTVESNSNKLVSHFLRNPSHKRG